MKVKATRRQKCTIAFTALALLSFAPQASAYSPTDQEVQNYRSLSDAEKVKLLMTLVRDGDHDFAEALLKNIPLEGKFAANRTLYIQGLVLKARGDLTGSVKKFRSALADDPSLTLVRAELAKTLVVLDQDGSAKHHLKLLAAEAPNEEAGASIRAFIDQIDAKRPYKISGSISLAPSTNVNSGSNDKTIYYSGSGLKNLSAPNPDAKKSGLGVAASVNAAYTKRLGNDFVGVVGTGVSTNIYSESKLNSATLSGTSEIRYLLDGGYLGAGLAGRVSTANSGVEWTHATAFGPRLSLVKQLNQRESISTNLLIEKRDRSDSDFVDGYAYQLNADYTFTLNSSTVFSSGYGLELTDLNKKSESYKAFNTSISVYKELSHGITVNALADVRRAAFDGPHGLTGDNRDDTRLIGNVVLTKRDLNFMGFAPSIAYTYTRNMSDVQLFDYDSHAVDFRLTTQF